MTSIYTKKTISRYFCDTTLLMKCFVKMQYVWISAKYSFPQPKQWVAVFDSF